MKKIFTLLFVFTFTVSLAQQGNIDLAMQSDVSNQTKEANGEILMPGDWATAGQVGTYRWVDADDNPIGWIFGNNTYGHRATAMPFEVDDAMEVVGAYVWISTAGPGDGDVHFRVMAFNGSIGDELGSVSVPYDDIEVLATGEGVTPDMYDEAMYIEFDSPITVDGEFAFVVDYGDIDWTEHGDGLGLASTVGSGASLAMIMEEDGTWVMGTDINAGLIFDIGMFPHVQAADEPDTYMLTLNVDMAGAVAEGDVEFDPAIHHVWVTGTFADWATPGENEDFQMQPANNVTKDEQVLYQENFYPATEDGLLPEGWDQKKADNAQGDNLQDLAEGDTRWFRYSELFFPYENFNPDWVHTDDASMHINWDIEDEENVYAISPEIQLPNADEITLEFWMYFVSVQTWHTLMDVLIYFDGEWEVLAQFNSETDHNEFDSPVHIDLSGRVGTARIAWVYKWNDGVQMNVDAIKVTAYGVDDDPDPDEDIYTITFAVTGGTHEYKYFLVEDDPTWDLGEWEGEPNRSITVDADKEVDDVFGEPPVSILEPESADIVMNIFPNPATTEINVEAEEMIRQIIVYDITGRQVMQVGVNNNTHTLSLITLREGFYIMQVHTESGVEGRRFHVTR